MLENCLSGSEGGGAFALPTPIFSLGLRVTHVAESNIS
jgi:hypothetical protein